MKPRRHYPRPLYYSLTRPLIDGGGYYPDEPVAQSIPTPKLKGSAPKPSPRAQPLLVQFNADNAEQRPVLGSGMVFVSKRGGP